MRRVLMVSPHFPPDNNAATHRVRLLAPHLPKYGWEPTVVTVDSRDYEGELDPRLLDLVPRDLRVLRCRAWKPRWTRALGIGDLGIRALTGLRTTCSKLLVNEQFDALFITIYPSYSALLGPMLKRRFGVPFVLDYQDPWVGEWGRSVGGGPNGRTDFKSRLTRTLGLLLEPHVVRAADAISAVSLGTYELVRERYHDDVPSTFAAVPLGGEAADFECLRGSGTRNPFFDPDDGFVHVSSVGATLPLGIELVQAVFTAAAFMKSRRPDLYARLRLHFFGTSNQTAGNADPRVLPLAQDLGIADSVTEYPKRISYFDSLKVQIDSSVTLLIGSRERHYTASKIYPALLAGRPILAVYHEASSSAEVLRRAGTPPAIRLITIREGASVASYHEPLFEALAAAVEHPVFPRDVIDPGAISEYSAEALARRLAAVLSRVARRAPAC